jgi:hypothetical protein
MFLFDDGILQICNYNFPVGNWSLYKQGNLYLSLYIPNSFDLKPLLGFTLSESDLNDKVPHSASSL